MERVRAGYAAPRFLLFHLQPISARLLFMRHATGSVLAPSPLPFLSSPCDYIDEAAASPLGLAQQVELGLRINADLGFEPGLLVIEPEFLRRAEIPRAVVDVHLARFSTHDPPFEAVRAAGGELRPITELRGAHPVEMAMLQWAYEHLLTD